VLVKVKVI